MPVRSAHRHLQPPPAEPRDHARHRRQRRDRQPICAQLLYLEGEDDKPRTSGSTSTAPVVRSRPAWRSTTRCSSSAATSPPSASAWPPRWASSSSAPAPQGKRYTLPNARIMMHQPLGRSAGPGGRHRHPGRAARVHQAPMAELIAVHTGQTRRADHADSDRDRWFTAEAADGLRHRRQGDRAPRRDRLPPSLILEPDRRRVADRLRRRAGRRRGRGRRGGGRDGRHGAEVDAARRRGSLVTATVTSPSRRPGVRRALDRVRVVGRRGAADRGRRPGLPMSRWARASRSADRRRGARGRGALVRPSRRPVGGSVSTTTPSERRGVALPSRVAERRDSPRRLPSHAAGRRRRRRRTGRRADRCMTASRAAGDSPTRSRQYRRRRVAGRPIATPPRYR